jgi:hypothetical protein
LPPAVTATCPNMRALGYQAFVDNTRYAYTTFTDQFKGNFHQYKLNNCREWDFLRIRAIDSSRALEAFHWWYKAKDTYIPGIISAERTPTSRIMRRNVPYSQRSMESSRMKQPEKRHGYGNDKGVASVMITTCLRQGRRMPCLAFRLLQPGGKA